MQIPEKYIGHWVGWIADDKKLKKPYKAEIDISTNGIQTKYHFVQLRSTNGTIHGESEVEGCLVFEETVASWSGTLRLSLDADGNLKCEWQQGKRITSRATLPRG